MPIPGGVGTALSQTWQQLLPVRRTGFSHRVGALWSTTWLRPFVVDRNICHFLWYGGVAGDGLRSVGVEALPSSKSVYSILPVARRLSSRGFRAPAFAWIIGY